MHQDKRALVETLRHYRRHILGPLFVEAADTIDELLQRCEALEKDNAIISRRLDDVIHMPYKIKDYLYAPTRDFVSTFRVRSFVCCPNDTADIWIYWDLEDGIYGDFRTDGVLAIEIGRTVFFTREEAEAALRAKQTEEVSCGDACDIKIDNHD